jgi:hypothetical protein
MTQIIQQVQSGINEILKYSRESDLYLCGHSAGLIQILLILIPKIKY